MYSCATPNCTRSVRQGFYRCDPCTHLLLDTIDHLRNASWRNRLKSARNAVDAARILLDDDDPVSKT